MINILLSVKRPYSRYILNDEKHDELRKTAPSKFKKGNTTIYLYESGGDGNHAIIGKCEMVEVSYVAEVRGTIKLRILAAQARVGLMKLVNYLPCFVWKIGSPELFLNAVPLSAIGMTRPPQSWQYLTDEQAAILEGKKKMKTCADCRYWSSFDGCCWCSSSTNYMSELYGDTKACEDFKPEKTK